MEECLFCHPYEKTQLSFGETVLDHRVLYETDYFYVLLGLGAIVEGYTLLVAKEHTRSMFDLADREAEAYEIEKKSLKKLIQMVYGYPVIVTEHGRVQACMIEDSEAHEHLCYHAHQLFFPNPKEIDLSQLEKEGPFEKVFEGSSLSKMKKMFLEEGDEYLLYEDGEDRLAVFKVRGKCPRQYMRYLVARSIGKPEWSSWAAYPFEDRIISAHKRYQPYLPVRENDRERHLVSRR